MASHSFKTIIDYTLRRGKVAKVTLRKKAIGCVIRKSA